MRRTRAVLVGMHEQWKAFCKLLVVRFEDMGIASWRGRGRGREEEPVGSASSSAYEIRLRRYTSTADTSTTGTGSQGEL
eukprot:SAG11_NODE_630_length_8069_cov_2.158344_1_plen_79_part_00